MARTYIHWPTFCDQNHRAGALGFAIPALPARNFMATPHSGTFIEVSRNPLYVVD